MWAVQLVGDPGDLGALSLSFKANDLTISPDGEEYLLRSGRFLPEDTADVVRQKAEEITTMLDGASRLVLASVQPITAGAVYRYQENGGRGVYVFVKPGVLTLRAFAPSVLVGQADETVREFHPSDPVKSWVGAATKSEAVRRVLGIYAGGTLDWVNLYRVIEIVLDDVGGLAAIQGEGWATKTAMERFKHTANSPGAVGLEARHGVETTDPPKKPMAISEAKALVNFIVHSWLGSKEP